MFFLVSDSPETNRWISKSEVDFISAGREQLVARKELELEGNSYLSQRFIDSFPWILKLKIIRLKQVLLDRELHLDFILIFVENCL